MQTFFQERAKRAGAWMTSYQSMYTKEGTEVRPHISIVCNFTPPTGLEACATNVQRSHHLISRVWTCPAWNDGTWNLSVAYRDECILGLCRSSLRKSWRIGVTSPKHWHCLQSTTRPVPCYLRNTLIRSKKVQTFLEGYMTFAST
jgi:hypothetical protein